MPTIQSKEEIVRLVQKLPDEVSLDDVIERLILIRKVKVGLAEEGQGVLQSMAEAEFRKPRQERSWNVAEVVWRPQALRDLEAIEAYSAARAVPLNGQLHHLRRANCDTW